MRWLSIPLIILTISLAGCPGPDISVSGDQISSAEKTDGDWRPIERWTLEEISPGRWFELSSSAFGTSGDKMQHVNVIIDGTPQSVRSDDGRVRFVRCPSVLEAKLVRYLNDDGDEKYELTIPSGGK